MTYPKFVALGKRVSKPNGIVALLQTTKYKLILAVILASFSFILTLEKLVPQTHVFFVDLTCKFGTTEFRHLTKMLINEFLKKIPKSRENFDLFWKVRKMCKFCGIWNFQVRCTKKCEFWAQGCREWNWGRRC